MAGESRVKTGETRQSDKMIFFRRTLVTNVNLERKKSSFYLSAVKNTLPLQTIKEKGV